MASDNNIFYSPLCLLISTKVSTSLRHICNRVPQSFFMTYTYEAQLIHMNDER